MKKSIIWQIIFTLTFSALIQVQIHNNPTALLVIAGISILTGILTFCGYYTYTINKIEFPSGTWRIIELRSKFDLNRLMCVLILGWVYVTILWLTLMFWVFRIPILVVSCEWIYSLLFHFNFIILYKILSKLVKHHKNRIENEIKKRREEVGICD